MADDATTEISRVEVQYASTGADKVASDFTRVQAAQDGLQRSSTGLAGATDTLTRSTLSVQKSLDAWTKKYDPLSRAQAEYEAGLTRVNKAVAQGIPVSDANMRALENSKTKLDELSRSLAEHGKAHSLNTMQLAEFGHIARASLDELGAGASPMQVLRTEGARLVQAFGENSGGVSGTLKGLGSAVGDVASKALSLANPFTLGAAAVVGLGAAATMAISHVRELREEMDRAVSGVGHMSGLTGEGLNALATASAARTGVGLGDSRATAEALAATGKFDDGNISGVMSLTRGYAGAYGVSNGEAGSKLAETLADPLKGLDQLNERLGFLDYGTRETVRSLVAQGDAQGALKVATDAAAASLNEMARPQGTFEKLGSWWSDRNAKVEAFISNATAPASAEQQYAKAQALRANTLVDPRLVDDGSDFAAEDLRHKGMLAGTSPLMRSPQAELLSNQQSLSAGEIMKGVLPDYEAHQRLVDQQASLSRSLSNPDTVAKLGDAAGPAREALAQLNVELGTFKTGAERVAEQSTLTIAGIQARTFAEKTAADYQKTYVEALERTHSVLEATATAEAHRNEAIASATRQAIDNALPEDGALTKLADDIGLLRDALNQPGASSLTQRAYTTDVVRQGHASPAQRQQEDYQLAIASADAFSVAERAAVEARRAELQVLRDGGDLVRAQAVAQMAVNEAVAKANSDAKDRLGLAQQEAGYVGLSSYQRGRRQLIDSFSGYGGQFTKDAGEDGNFRSNLAESMKPVATDLRSAGQLVVEALRGVAGGIAGTNTPVSVAGSLPTLARGGAGMATPEMIADAAARTGIPASVIAAVGQVENGGRLSGGTTMLGSNGKPSSAWGYGQLTNAAAADVAQRYPGFDKYDPATAVFGSAAYLRIQMDRHNGSLTGGLQGYGGTSDYAGKVMSRVGGGIAIPMSVSQPNTSTAPAPITSTALATDKSVLATKVGAYDASAYLGPLQESAQSLAAMNAELKVQQDMLGQSKEKIAAAAYEQKLLNQYQKEMIPITPALSASIKELSTEYGDYTKRSQDFQRQQQQSIGAQDGVRSTFDSSANTLIQGLMHGKSSRSLFSSIGETIGGNLISSGIGGLTSSLFGKSGTSGGGLFGGGLSSLLGNLMGGFQGWMPHFALGGVMSAGGPMPLRKYATGGVANTPQVAVYGEGAHTEAYVPLPDGRSIPVSMKSAAANKAVSTSNQVNIGGHTIVVQGSADKDSLAQMKAELDRRDAVMERKMTRNLSTMSANSRQYED